MLSKDKKLRIGIDFDNTIVCYDGVFYAGALERGWLTKDVGSTKTAVRDYLRDNGREECWTELQGLVYGPFMAKALPFPGVKEFLQKCHRRQIEVYIVSHRTKVPYLGHPYDLHQAARDWLQKQGFIQKDLPLLREEQVFFEVTKTAKQQKIRELDCTHFIDDLPEFLGDQFFPVGPEKILFDPADVFANEERFLKCHSWQEICNYLDIE